MAGKNETLCVLGCPVLFCFLISLHSAAPFYHIISSIYKLEAREIDVYIDYIFYNNLNTLKFYTKIFCL